MDLLNGLLGDMLSSLMDDDSLSNRLGSSLVGIPISTLLALVHVRPKLRARVVLAGRFGTLLSLRMETATTSRVSQPSGNKDPRNQTRCRILTGRSLMSPIGHYRKLFLIIQADHLKT